MKLTTVVALLALAGSAHAQMQINAQAVKVIVPYQTTCSTAAVSTAPVEITGNTQVPSTSYSYTVGAGGAGGNGTNPGGTGGSSIIIVDEYY